MSNSIQEDINQIQNLTTIISPTDINTTFVDDTNNNKTNSSLFSNFLYSLDRKGFSWEFHWNLIIILALGLILIIVLLSSFIWYRFNRKHRILQQHSLPNVENNLIEAIAFEDKRLSSSPIIHRLNQPPPVPPRPTAYPTSFGKVEYRSNL